MTSYHINNPDDNKYNDVLNKISINNSIQNYNSVNYIIPEKNPDDIDFDFNYFNTTIDNLNYDLTINLELFRKSNIVNNKYKYKIYTIQTKYEFGGVVTISITKGTFPYREYKLLSNNNSINFIIIDDEDINHLYSSFNLLNINSDYYSIPRNSRYTIPNPINNNSLYINLDYKYIYINNSISSLELVLNSPNNTNFNNKDNTLYTFQLLYPYGFAVKIITRPLVGSFILDSSNSTIKLSYIDNLWTILQNKKNSSYITANKDDQKNNTIPLIFRTIKEQNYKSIGNQLSVSKDARTIAFSAVNASGLSSSIFIYKYDKKTTNWYRETLISTINDNNIIENITLNTKILLSGDGNKLFISNIRDNINNDDSVIYNIYSKNQKIIIVGKDSNNYGLIGYSNDGITWVSSVSGSELFNIRGEGRSVSFSQPINRYVAVGKDKKNGVIGYSTDGIQWIKSEQGSGLFGVGGLVYDVIWNVDKFIAVGKTKINGLIVYSYNGINWVSSVSGSSLLGKGGVGYSINLSGNVLNVTGNNSIIGSSLNGIDWYKQDTTNLYGVNNKSGIGYNITSSNSRAVVVGKYFPSNVNKGIVGYIDIEGTWNRSDSGSHSDLFGDGEAFGVAVSTNTSIFVAVGKNKTSGLIVYSTDGNIWYKSISGSELFGVGGFVYNIIWDGSKFIAVGKTKTSALIASSADGNIWIKINTPELFRLVIQPILIIKGKVCVYTRTIENKIVNWTNNQIISEDACTKNFGISLALSYNDLIIGDTGDNSVYCYKFNGTRWVFSQKITVYNSGIYSNFGNSISISPNGEMFVVGGPGGVSNNRNGGIWVYTKNNDGIFESYLNSNEFTLPEEYINQKEFGYNVLISPDFKNIIVSSKYKGLTGDYNVFIYEIRNKSCYLVYKTKADQDYAIDFGKSMVITGDSNVLIIGSPSLSSPNESYIYIYKKENGLWVYLTKYKNSNILYGSSLSLQDNGNLLLVGIPTDDFNSSIVIHT